MIGATMSSDYEEFADGVLATRERAAGAIRDALRRARAADGSTAALASEVERATAVLLHALAESESKLRAAVAELFEARLHLEADAIRFREYFERAPCGYVVTDHEGRIVSMNDAAESMLDRGRNTMLRKPLGAFVALDDRDGFRQALRRAMTTDQVDSWSVRIAPPRGRVCECTVRVRRVVTGGTTMLYWLLLEDWRAEDLF